MTGLSAPGAPIEGTSRITTIHLGQYAAHRGVGEIRTLLGSCVCVCLWDPVAQIGGANHFQLPAGDSRDRSARYGIHAMELLINRMMAFGADRRRFRAMAFGGGAVTAALDRQRVGDRNIQFTREFFEAEGIPLVGGDVGGRWPRKVRFRVDRGVAACERLPETGAEAIALEELRAATADSPADHGSDVVLFQRDPAACVQPAS